MEKKRRNEVVGAAMGVIVLAVGILGLSKMVGGRVERPDCTGWSGGVVVDVVDGSQQVDIDYQIMRQWIDFLGCVGEAGWSFGYDSGAWGIGHKRVEVMARPGSHELVLVDGEGLTMTRSGSEGSTSTVFVGGGGEVGSEVVVELCNNLLLVKARGEYFRLGQEAVCIGMGTWQKYGRVWFWLPDGNDAFLSAEIPEWIYRQMPVGELVKK